jgi:hypothetical protein
MAWITPVTDRTLADIENLTDKAFFNIADWIRINGDTTYVRALINVLRGINIEYNSLTTPEITTFPTATEINRFVENIETLRSISCLPVNLGIVPLKTDYLSVTNATPPNFEDVNDWERDLQLLRLFTISTSVYMVYCGVAAVGQPRHWQNRSRTKFIMSSISPVRRTRMGVGAAGSTLARQNGFRRYDS